MLAFRFAHEFLHASLSRTALRVRAPVLSESAAMARMLLLSFLAIILFLVAHGALTPDAQMAQAEDEDDVVDLGTLPGGQESKKAERGHSA